jgi:hypothetical protein
VAQRSAAAAIPSTIAHAARLDQVRGPSGVSMRTLPAPVAASRHVTHGLKLGGSAVVRAAPRRISIRRVFRPLGRIFEFKTSPKGS